MLFLGALEQIHTIEINMYLVYQQHLQNDHLIFQLPSSGILMLFMFQSISNWRFQTSFLPKMGGESKLTCADWVVETTVAMLPGPTAVKGSPTSPPEILRQLAKSRPRRLGFTTMGLFFAGRTR